LIRSPIARTKDRRWSAVERKQIDANRVSTPVLRRETVSRKRAGQAENGQAGDNDADQGLNALENEDIEDELEERSSGEEEYILVDQIEVNDVRLPSVVILWCL
jgi:hypothetical protein